MPNDKIVLAKRTVNLIVGLSVTKLVNTLIQNNTDPQTATEKVSTAVGSYVVGSMVADAASSYTDAKIDSVVAWYRENVNVTKPE